MLTVNLFIGHFTDLPANGKGLLVITFSVRHYLKFQGTQSAGGTLYIYVCVLFEHVCEC